MVVIKHRARGRPWAVWVAVAGLLAGMLSAVPADAAPVGRTYTADADFDEGLLFGVNHIAPNSNQLQLNTESSTFPFIWVANSAEGTISKLDTVTGAELGRYRTAPDGVAKDPSRTTVDLDGNVWVGNRQSNTITKVGLRETGNCIDRNGNGAIETSTGAADVRLWPAGSPPADECILLHVTLPAATGGNIRTVAIDASNNVYTGGTASGLIHYVNGQTGALIRTITNPIPNNYGGVVDPDGNLWIATQGYGRLIKYMPATDTFQNIWLGHFSYGLGVDRFGHIWVSGWTNNVISKIRRSDGAIVGTYPTPGGTCGRGLAVTDDGDVWLANSCTHNVNRLGNDGSNKGTVPAGNQPTGVAIDAAGKVWVTNLGSNNVTRIDPAGGASATFAVGAGPYNYSDMTGYVVRNITRTQGTWTVTHDGGEAGAFWGTLSWNGSTPAGTSISARVRAADSQAGLGGQTYVSVSNNGATGVTGRYIQIEMTLATNVQDVTPVLHDVTIAPGLCDPHVTFHGVNAGGEYEVPVNGSLDIRFSYGNCRDFFHDESVIIMITDPAWPDYPIAAWVYGSDIIIDDTAKVYSQVFWPALYGLSAGTSLQIQVYIDYAPIGTATLHITP